MFKAKVTDVAIEKQDYPRLWRAKVNPNTIAMQIAPGRAICVCSDSPSNPPGTEWTQQGRGEFTPHYWEPFYGSVTITSEP